MSPTQLKEFRLQQEEQRKLRLEEIKNKEKELKKIRSPKDFFNPETESVEEIIAPVCTDSEIIEDFVEKTSYELLEDKVDALISILDDFNNLHIPEEFNPEDIQGNILNLKELFFNEISKLKTNFNNLPKVKYYDEELDELKNRILSIQESIPDVAALEARMSAIESQQADTIIPNQVSIAATADKTYNKLVSVGNTVDSIYTNVVGINNVVVDTNNRVVSIGATTLDIKKNTNLIPALL